MSAFNGLKFTRQGLELQAKAQTGTSLTYTRIGIGEGFYTGDILDITKLVKEVMSLPISSIRVSGEQAIIGSSLTNADLAVGFYLREIGVYATDPDIGEILYCYANAGEFAGYIPAAGGGDLLEKEVELITVVGTASNVNAIIDPSVFVTAKAVDAKIAVVQEALDVHVGNTGIHVTPSQKATWDAKEDKAKKGQPGGYAPLDLTAKVPTQHLPDSILGQVEYISTWNASTNTPELSEASEAKGNYYVTDTAGTFQGIEFKVGDWVISNGDEWQKVDNTDAVPTVFGRTGNILAAQGDYSAEQISLNSPHFASSDVKGGMEELFTSVSDGKALVAASITDKGVETASDASFQTMADNIADISTGDSVAVDWTVRTGAADKGWISVCYGNGLFVAVAGVGAGNRVMTSPDGINWTARTGAGNNNWTSVCYGNGLFVAVAYSGTGNRVMTSPDGITWTTRTSAADKSWRSVCYGNGLFVAVAGSGTGNRVMTSPDGINWTARTSAADNDWRTVTYGNGLFVAVAYSGTENRVMTSPDGITWTLRTSAADDAWYSVCYGNGLFVAVAISGTGNRIMTSPDGITWTIRTSAADNGWRSVAYGNGLFVAVASSGTGNRVMTSPDGINWTARTSAADNSWTSVCYGNGLFVAVADSGVGNRVMTSGTLDDSSLAADYALKIIRPGIWWKIGVNPNSSNRWNAVTYGNGLFVAVAGNGTGDRVMTSTDGISWTSRSSAADISWNAVTYGNGMFVAVASSGTGNRVMTSPDGINWTSRTSAADLEWMSVCYGNGLFVAVAWTSANGSSVMTSPNGISWTLRTSPTDIQWRSVTYGDGKFIAVSVMPTGDKFMTSTDGISWALGSLPANYNWKSITYGNGTFVAVATSGYGRVISSQDGINWTLRTSPADYLWQSVTYGAGLFVAVAGNGTGDRVMTSPDGINWTARTSAADYGWAGVAYGNGMFVAVASSGIGGDRAMVSKVDGL